MCQSLSEMKNFKSSSAWTTISKQWGTGELSNEELLEVARENSAGCTTDQVDEVEPEEIRPLTAGRRC
ncbi:Hypothetical protein FKW44_024281 [Caligus rogercresseyi]|uniref:Uncharacterized protein n=1 Tax=Caligus rogercresseyi TaxID=217165 RepID=A0A7T8GMK2_CALRO|nr:Hypothetical protein FKW44_024281 [Caligus rogercresseyi]